MREPVRQTTMSPGFRPWLITGYPEARAALADQRLGKDSRRVAELLDRHSRGGSESIFGQSLSHHMLNSDPPEHGRLRGLVNGVFTARRVELLRSRVAEICAELLAELPDGEEVDLLDRFAFPLPVNVISELLGVPARDRARFRSWSNHLVSALPREVVREASTAMSTYLRELVRGKETDPGEDLLSALVHTGSGQDRLTLDELVAMAFLLLAAGHETTVNLIGNGVLALLTHPDQLAALRADRTRLAGAIEELLRYDGPINQVTLRFTREPVEIGGVRIPADEFVVISLDSANHDPRRFPNPDVLDIGRDAGGHLAFGRGIHHCLGAPLARLEGEIAFAGLLDTFRHLELAVPVERLEWRFSVVMRGLERLPVRLHR